MRALRAGFAYFLQVFALGFVLGTIRTLWLAPAWGEGVAVLAELPVMLGASWWLARRLVARHAIGRASDALLMGLFALLLLMAAEAGLAVLVLGQQPQAWLTGLFALPGVYGLAGQLCFAAFPVLARTGKAVH